MLRSSNASLVLNFPQLTPRRVAWEHSHFRAFCFPFMTPIVLVGQTLKPYVLLYIE
jgi:hypothetical protein